MKSKCKNCNKEISYYSSNRFGVWCSNRCQGDFAIKKRFKNGTAWRYYMRNYLLRSRGEKCENCQITHWNGKKISLHIDHVNGNRKDNRLKNLKILCPNCHSQTETWGIKNISEKGKKRLITNGKRRGGYNKKK